MTTQFKIVLAVLFVLGCFVPPGLSAAFADAPVAVDAGVTPLDGGPYRPLYVELGAGIAPSLCPSGMSAARGSDGALSCGSATVAVNVPPGHLDDPAENPLAAWNDIKTAQKVGWPALVFTVLAMLLKITATYYRRLDGVPLLGSLSAWLSVGKRAMACAGLATVATTVALALTAGTAWTAAAAAGLFALVGVTRSTVTPA